MLSVCKYTKNQRYIQIIKALFLTKCTYHHTILISDNPTLTKVIGYSDKAVSRIRGQDDTVDNEYQGIGAKYVRKTQVSDEAMQVLCSEFMRMPEMTGNFAPRQGNREKPGLTCFDKQVVLFPG